jgi:hypothetical protein
MARARRGEADAGVAYTVVTVPHGVLVALAEGSRDGPDAARAARTALAVVETRAFAPLPLIVHDCHRELADTAGVALSLALFDSRRPLIWWVGVGHLPGYVMPARRGSKYKPLPLQSGVVGHHIPPLAASSLSLSLNDTLIVVTDSVRWDPGRAPGRLDVPFDVAERLLVDYTALDDQAAVVVARYLGPRVAPNEHH